MKPAWLQPSAKPKTVEVDGHKFATKGESERYVAFRDRVTGCRVVFSDPDRGSILFEGRGPDGRMLRESYHLKTKGTNKYGAITAQVDGIKFDSRREARRWKELTLLVRAGEITGLERQVKFPLLVLGAVLGHYIADFVYSDRRSGRQVIEDAKGMKTPMYRWKKKHLAAQTGIQIREV